MIKIQADPLERLLINADEVDRAKLATGLAQFLAIDSETGRLDLKRGFHKLDSKRKVLVCLLGVKAANLLGRADHDAIAPKEITSHTGVPAGTVRPSLASLLEARLVARTADGKYSVAPYQLLDALDFIAQRENADERD